MVSHRLFRRYYPGQWHDGSLAFYGWIRQHLRPDMRVLNLGAGPATRSTVRTLRGEVAAVVGADPDPVVLHNPELDEAHVIRGGSLPFDAASFDLALADYVFEHVDGPEGFLKEAARVLKPGAALFFRTPNKRHYVALVARMTPYRFHLLVANRARCLPHEAHPPWPTFYRLNDPVEVARCAIRAGFSVLEYRMFEPEPSYLVFHWTAFLAGVAYERTVNRFQALAGLRANIFGKLIR